MRGGESRRNEFGQRAAFYRESRAGADGGARDAGVLDTGRAAAFAAGGVGRGAGGAGGGRGGGGAPWFFGKRTSVLRWFPGSVRELRATGVVCVSVESGGVSCGV